MIVKNNNGRIKTFKYLCPIAKVATSLLVIELVPIYSPSFSQSPIPLKAECCKMNSNLMLIPSFSCPAGCRYCFGPSKIGSDMSQETLEAIIHWQRSISDGNKLEITFHGGEPLVPGADFYKMALPLLREHLAPREVSFGMQSNLWLLTKELCELFKKHEVSLGTSLDGPEAINDAQRGNGYFKNTMAGIKLARSYGLSTGCICTFTAQSAKKTGAVFDFFLREGLDFSIHAALKPFGQAANGYALSPAEHGRLLIDMLDRYLEHTTRIGISTLDAMARSISAGKGGICTFCDCLGQYLAVDPDGWIYPCQRLAGIPMFRLGSVYDYPATDNLEKAPAWQMLRAREERVSESCGECPHLAYCRGGCPYNVLGANNGRLDGDLRDPHCPAYRQTFDEITERAMVEVFSGENMTAVASGGSEKYGLLRKGRLLKIMRGSPHPREAARQARQTVAAAALGICGTPESALAKLDQAGVITNPTQALESLKALRNRLDTQSSRDLLNAYIHVTSACNLSCQHCYAAAKSPHGSESMNIEEVERLVTQAAKAGFTKAVITGGEPLVHPYCEELLVALSALRQKVKPMKIVLRTNLAFSLTSKLARQLLKAADEVVVSIDGDMATHDTRRGKGSYACTLENLQFLLDRSKHDNVPNKPVKFAARISIAATLEAEHIEGPAGDAVRKLGEDLNMDVRFKAVLPLGRGAQLDLKHSFYSSLDDESEAFTHGAYPKATCGLGMNLYIGPNGECNPCYALMAQRHYLGNALSEGLKSILARNNAYRQVTVDSNLRCSKCELRYLCGGFCRAWSKSDNPNAPLPDCSTLYQRATKLLNTAFEVLEISKGNWKRASLPWPEK